MGGIYFRDFWDISIEKHNFFEYHQWYNLLLKSSNIPAKAGISISAISITRLCSLLLCKYISSARFQFFEFQLFLGLATVIVLPQVRHKFTHHES